MRTTLLVLFSTAFFAGQPAERSVQGLATVAGRPQRDVVVWLEVKDRQRSIRPRAVLDQRNQQFVPRLLVVEVGTVIELPNNDRVFHNVFSFKDGKRFDLGLYPTGASKQLHFDTPGVSRVFCNIHPQMAAYIVAVESPYFAVSDERGVFALHDVPAGTYEYRAWRAGGSPLSGSTAIGPGNRFDVGWP